MISDEMFFDRVMQKFDQIEVKINELCDKIAKSNAKINEHLAINDALDKKVKSDLKNRDRKFYILIAVMGIGFTLFELIDTFVNGG